MKIQKNIITGIALSLLILVVVSFWYLFIKNDETGLNNEGEAASTSTVSIGGVNMEVSGPGGALIEPISDIPAPPKYPRVITYPKDFSSEARRIMKKTIDDIVSELNENNTNTDAWIQLGLRYKQLGDYEGAREAWEYASLLSPGNVVSFNNLGDLYHYYLKDYKKSEANFLTAIQNDSVYALSYKGLHDLYRYSYKKDGGAAATILIQGIKANPQNIDLIVALASYYAVDKGDEANALVYYKKALALASAAGNTALVKELEDKIAALQ